MWHRPSALHLTLMDGRSKPEVWAAASRSERTGAHFSHSELRASGVFRHGARVFAVSETRVGHTTSSHARHSMATRAAWVAQASCAPALQAASLALSRAGHGAARRGAWLHLRRSERVPMPGTAPGRPGYSGGARGGLKSLASRRARVCCTVAVIRHARLYACLVVGFQLIAWPGQPCDGDWATEPGEL